MERTTHKVAIVVFCEAEGLTPDDAASGAQIALTRLIYENALPPEAQQYVGTVRTLCPECGINFMGPDDVVDGLIPRHVPCERFAPEDLELEEGDPHPDLCEGSGQPPRQPDQPVIGFTRQDRLPIYARVHQVMEAGMAAGNGHLWLQPTWKSF